MPLFYQIPQGLQICVTVVKPLITSWKWLLTIQKLTKMDTNVDMEWGQESHMTNHIMRKENVGNMCTLFILSCLIRSANMRCDQCRKTYRDKYWLNNYMKLIILSLTRMLEFLSAPSVENHLEVHSLSRPT